MKKPETFVFFLNKKNENPTIQNVRYPVSVSIPLIDEIYDDKADTNRVIRYMVGEKSIYLDEQTNKDKTKKSFVEFTNGMKVVDHREKTLLDFMRKSNYNTATENRMPGITPLFHEYVPGKGSEVAMENEERVIRAKSAVYDLDVNTLLSVARSVNINTQQDPRDVRYAVSKIAEKDPERFMKILKSPNTSRKNTILQAIDKGIIYVDKKSKTVRWLKTDQAIITAPVAVDPIDYLVDFTFSIDGELFLSEIIKLTKVEVKQEQEREKQESNPHDEVITMSNDELLDKAVELMVIQRHGQWHSFASEKIGRRPEVIELLSKPAFNQEIRAMVTERMIEQKA